MTPQTLHTTDGLALSARTWPAAGTARAGVVLVHGFTATKEHPEVIGLAEALAAAGFEVLAYDARGHGASEGTCTLGHEERADVAAAVAALRVRHPVVVVVGASMGGIAALRYAADDAELAGVVTVSTPAHWRLPRSLKGVLLAALTQTPPGRALVARQLRVRLSRRWEGGAPPIALAARLRIPFAAVHGTDDGYVARQAAHDLYDAASGPRRLEVVQGMGHAFDTRAIPAVRDAVEWMLREAAVTR